MPPLLDTIPVRVRRRGFGFALAVVIVLWLGVGGALTALAAWSLLDEASLSPLAARAGAAAFVLAWLLFGAWLLLYGVFDAHRYAFGRDDLRMLSWRGRRRFAWADAEAARLVASRSGLVLVITFRPRTWARIPIVDYYGSARLMADIERRLPVAVAAHPRLQAALEAADAR